MEAPVYLSDPHFNPRQLTKAKLSSILSEHRVDLPVGAQKKQVYLDLFEREILDRREELLEKLLSVIPSDEGVLKMRQPRVSVPRRKSLGKPDLVAIERTPTKPKTISATADSEEEEDEEEEEEEEEEDDEEEVEEKENSPVKKTVVVNLGKAPSTPRHSSIAPVRELGKRFDSGPAMIPRSSLTQPSDRASKLAPAAEPLDPEEIKRIGKSIYERVAAESLPPIAEERLALRGEEEIIQSIKNETTAEIEGEQPQDSRVLVRILNLIVSGVFLGMAYVFLRAPVEGLSLSQKFLLDWEMFTDLVAMIPNFAESTCYWVYDFVVELDAAAMWSGIVTNMSQVDIGSMWMTAKEKLAANQYWSLLLSFAKDSFAPMIMTVQSMQEYLIETVLPSAMAEISRISAMSRESVNMVLEHESVAAIVNKASEIVTLFDGFSIESIFAGLVVVFFLCLYVTRLMGIRKNAKIVAEEVVDIVAEKGAIAPGDCFAMVFEEDDSRIGWDSTYASDVWTAACTKVLHSGKVEELDTEDAIFWQKKE
ncbi:MAG: hypothetical protein SGCHY_004162 [Lobulomycetales sp.]